MRLRSQRITIALLTIAILIGMRAYDRTIGGQNASNSAPEKSTEAAKETPKQISLDLGGGIKIELVLIQPGSFMMGDEKGDDEEKPVHKVTISKPFYMGKFEVTQEQWQAVMGTNPSHFKGAKNPVDRVSWEACQTFIKKLNEKFAAPASLQPADRGTMGIRLPRGLDIAVWFWR